MAYGHTRGSSTAGGWLGELMAVGLMREDTQRSDPICLVCRGPEPRDAARASARADGSSQSRAEESVSHERRRSDQRSRIR